MAHKTTGMLMYELGYRLRKVQGDNIVYSKEASEPTMSKNVVININTEVICSDDVVRDDPSLPRTIKARIDNVIGTHLGMCGFKNNVSSPVNVQTDMNALSALASDSAVVFTVNTGPNPRYSHSHKESLDRIFAKVVLARIDPAIVKDVAQEVWVNAYGTSPTEEQLTEFIDEHHRRYGE